MAKRIQDYKAVFFDASDTLLTVPDSHQTVRAYLAAEGLQREEAQVREALDEATRIHYLERDRPRFPICTPESDREYWIEIYMDMLERLDAEKERDRLKWRDCCGRMYDWFVSPQAYKLFDDVKPCLRTLAKIGKRMGVVSNFAPTLRETLRVHGILQAFDPVIVSTEVGIEKPDPEIFRLALREAGLYGSQVLYIGDHPINDIWASAQAGMDSVRILRNPQDQGDGIHSLLDLFDQDLAERVVKK